jgi:hypothetical protein
MADDHEHHGGGHHNGCSNGQGGDERDPGAHSEPEGVTAGAEAPTPGSASNARRWVASIGHWSRRT